MIEWKAHCRRCRTTELYIAGKSVGRVKKFGVGDDGFYIGGRRTPDGFRCVGFYPTLAAARRATEQAVVLEQVAALSTGDGA